VEPGRAGGVALTPGLAVDVDNEAALDEAIDEGAHASGAWENGVLKARLVAMNHGSLEVPAAEDVVQDVG
jgi:hypothetical protein